MKKLSKEAKFNLKNGFGSLINNRCAIEAGKSMPFWLSIIMGILGPALAMIPIIVNVANTNGSAAYNDTVNYNLDRNLAISMVDLTNKNAKLTVADHYLTYYENSQPVVVTGGKYEMQNHINSQSHQYSIRTYFLEETADMKIDALYKEITAEEFIIGTTTLKSDEDPKDTKYYKPMTLVFYNKGFAFSTFKDQTATVASSYSGDFANTVDCENLIARIATVDGVLPTTYEQIGRTGYLDGLKINTKKLLDEGYLQVKGRTFLLTSTIYFAIYVGITFFLGFLTFILTRGKRNFNNYLKWYQCIGISCWASISPGILALIFGFFMQSLALMIFILLMGVRIMWLTMKNLSPTATVR